MSNWRDRPRTGGLKMAFVCCLQYCSDIKPPPAGPGGYADGVESLAHLRILTVFRSEERYRQKHWDSRSTVKPFEGFMDLRVL